MPCARSLGLKHIDDVPGQLPMGLDSIRAFRIMDIQIIQYRKEITLLLGDDAERHQPRYQTWLDRAMWSKPCELLQVRSDKIDEYRLRHVIEVMTDRELIGAELTGQTVQAPPAEHATIGAWTKRAGTGQLNDLIQCVTEFFLK